MWEVIKWVSPTRRIFNELPLPSISQSFIFHVIGRLMYDFGLLEQLPTNTSQVPNFSLRRKYRKEKFIHFLSPTTKTEPTSNQKKGAETKLKQIYNSSPHSEENYLFEEERKNIKMENGTFQIIFFFLK